MDSFRVLFANCVTEISSVYSVFFRGFFSDFLTTKSPALFQYEITKDDIEYHSDKREGISYNIEISLPSLLYRIADSFIDNEVILLHGATIAVFGCSYVFTAPSGTGKTTHIMKWLEHCPDAFVVNGDKPFIRLNDDGTVLACGSPWAGKENLYTNTMVPLKSIILMERAEDNHIERISFAEAFPKLLQQTYRPEDPDKMRKTLKLMQRLNPAVSFWRFQCNNFKDDCFDVAYNALVGQDQ